MLKHRTPETTQAFKRDLLRDFCLTAAELYEQDERFAASGTLSFAVLHGLLGDISNKGPLWRLKDTAHLLIGQGEQRGEAEARLDWVIGYLFHECVKIMEQTYQATHYAPLVPQPPEGPGTALAALVERDRASLTLMMEGVGALIRAACRFFCPYLASEAQNRPLARLMHEREELLRKVFKEDYTRLLHSIYADAPELAPFTAALSLAESGRVEAARQAIQKALAMNPQLARAKELLSALNSGNSAPRR